MDSLRIGCRSHFILYNINDMDAFLLFVMPPLLGAGVYYIMKKNFVQSTIGYIKKRIGEKEDV
jgi:hypothetical protein